MSISIECASTFHAAKSTRICLLDFFGLPWNVLSEIFAKYRNFRDELIRKYPEKLKNSSQCQWTIELFPYETLDRVIQFNQHLKSMPERHRLIFVCFGQSPRPDEEAQLKSSYVNSTLFSLGKNSDEIFRYLQRKPMKSFHRKATLNFYPLLMHTNSISTGLVLNYSYSYLNRQIGSTNNIYLKLIFNQQISRQTFPSSISIRLNTLIEEGFLKNLPTTFDEENLQSIESKILPMNFDESKCQFSDENQTIVTYSIIGVQDFGSFIEFIRIYHEFSCLEHLISIELQDSVRLWNEQYYRLNNRFQHRQDPTRECRFLPMDQCPRDSHGFLGVSTMKKTDKDCYRSYITDPENHLTIDGRQIHEIYLIPVYFILCPLSCQFGPSDINETSQPNSMILQGTIIDPFQRDRIRLARVKNDVLQSAPMKHLDRYLRRTYYYFDYLNEDNQIIRYLFSGEYPNILSTIDQLEKCRLISSIEKLDEYYRFCNILHRLIEYNHLSESIQIIQYNDQIDHHHADFKPPCEQIREYIDQWYHVIDDLSIQTKILLPQSECLRVVLFYPNDARDNPEISLLIDDMKKRLENRRWIVEDIQGNIDEEQRILFVCIGRKFNRSIMNLTNKRMKKFGVLRDVFILINQSIEQFPCQFIRSIPYLTFDLQNSSRQLNDQDIEMINWYLTNMNVLSKTYQMNFDDINAILSTTPSHFSNIGHGCGMAFYFNYAKTIVSSADHHHRMKLIEKEIRKENVNDENYEFISKWIFLRPTSILNISQILSSLLLEKKNSSLKLIRWESKDRHFRVPQLTITIGGVFQRGFSPLSIYRLININNGKSFYFPMEIPAALNSLEKQHNDVLSHFHLGKYDPEKQALAFRKIIDDCFDKEEDQLFKEHVRFLDFDQTQSNEDFLEILWETLSSSTELNFS